jgi:hypothetical protein
MNHLVKIAAAVALASGAAAAYAQGTGTDTQNTTGTQDTAGAANVVGQGEVTSGPNRSVTTDTTTTGPGSYTGGAGAAPETLDEDQLRLGNAETSNDPGSWGWVGLLGLFGLLGMKARNREDRTVIHRDPATR